MAARAQRVPVGKQAARRGYLIALALLLGSCSAERDVHDTVRAALKDPESARFGETVVHASGVACGVVSSRNTLGGMVADMPFMLWGDELFLSDDAGERRVVVDCCIEVMRAAQSRRELDQSGKAACQGLPAGVPVSVLK